MASITKPILLNETGEKIVTAINDVAVAISNNSGNGSNHAADITIADESEHYVAANVEEALAEIAVNAENIKSKVTVLETNNTEVKIDIESLTGENNSIKSDITALTEKVGNIEANVSTTADKISVADTDEHYEGNNVEAALAEIATSVGNVSDKVASIESDNKAIKESVSTLETDNTSNKESISTLETENTSIKASIATLESDNTSTKESVATLTTKVNNLVSNPSATSTYFYSSGTYVVPDGVTKVYVSGCGGGAGGSACYGGGGAQSVIRKAINVTPGASISVTIGDGGSGSGSYSSISSWPSGTDGGTTSFGSYLSLHGGYAPKHNSSTARVTQWPKAGGNGGTAGMSNYVQWKDDSSQVWGGGQGGSSLFGVGGNGGVFDQASPTSSSYISAGDGIGYGSGGGSSCVQSSGRASAAGDGADGILIVEVI